MPDATVGYCTNVHAATTWPEMQAQLSRFACPVRERVAPAGTLPIGLWLPASATPALADPDRLREAAGWLASRGLEVFTINGFPFGDFHREVVKHDVYRPDWTDPRRVRYTERLARILAGLLPEGASGAISTLPVGWPEGGDEADRLDAAAGNLIWVAEDLERVEERTGRALRLALEPEPGCLLSTAADVVRFYRRVLARAPAPSRIRDRIGVCHDVCHAAVMFEEQADVLAAYRNGGVPVFKVQISSAVRIDFGAMTAAARQEARDRLRGFAEPRYLHQTVGRGRSGRRFAADLREALESWPPDRDEEWRVHFHVPVYAPALGTLGTTRDEIDRFLAARDRSVPPCCEIETYAWDVLPEGMGCGDLAEGIAREIEWFRARMAAP